MGQISNETDSLLCLMVFWEFTDTVTSRSMTYIKFTCHRVYRYWSSNYQWVYSLWDTLVNLIDMSSINMPLIVWRSREYRSLLYESYYSHMDVLNICNHGNLINNVPWPMMTPWHGNALRNSVDLWGELPIQKNSNAKPLCVLGSQPVQTVDLW